MNYKISIIIIFLLILFIKIPAIAEDFSTITLDIPQKTDPGISLIDITPEEAKADKKLLKGRIGIYADDENTKYGAGIRVLKDRIRIFPELTVGFAGTTNFKEPTGVVFRNRILTNFVLVKDRPAGHIGEGKINLRFDFGAGYNPTKDETLSLYDDSFSYARGPNNGVNIGNYLTTEFGFMDELNYTQDIRITKKLNFRQVYGLVDLREYFDKNAYANNTDKQFMNSAFANNRAFPANVSATSIIFQFHRKWSELTGAVSMMDPFDADNAFVGNYEFAFTPHFFGKEGHYRVGGCSVLGRNMGKGEYFFNDDNESIHFSGDQQITKNFGIFGRYGVVGISNANVFPFFYPMSLCTDGNKEIVHRGWLLKERRSWNYFSPIADYITSHNNGSNGIPVRQSISFGFEWKHPFKSKNGTFAFAYGQNYRIFRDKDFCIRGNPIPGFANFPNRSPEKVYELNYRHQLGKYFTLTPWLQLIFDRAGNKDNKMNVIFGIRTNWTI